MKRQEFNKIALKEIIKEMKKTDQIEGVQTIFEHGLSVANHYKSLINTIRDNTKEVKHQLYIPESLIPYFSKINNYPLLSDSKMRKYLMFHDMGKPSCYSKDVCG